MFRYPDVVAATPTDTDTTAPKTMPYATLPAAQPMSAPRTMQAVVDQKDTAGAGGWKFGREARLHLSEAAYLVTLERLTKPVPSKLVTRVVFVHGSRRGRQADHGSSARLPTSSSVSSSRAAATRPARRWSTSTSRFRPASSPRSSTRATTSSRSLVRRRRRVARSAPTASLASLTAPAGRPPSGSRGNAAVEEISGRDHEAFRASDPSPRGTSGSSCRSAARWRSPDRCRRGWIARATAIAERPPDEAEIPLDELAATPFPARDLRRAQPRVRRRLRRSSNRLRAGGPYCPVPGIRALTANGGARRFPRARVVIETKRLVRPFVRGDVEPLLALWDDPRNERFDAEQMPRSAADVLAWLRRWPAWGVWSAGKPCELVGDCSNFISTRASTSGGAVLRIPPRPVGARIRDGAARACARHGSNSSAWRRSSRGDPIRRTARIRARAEKCGFGRVGGKLEDGRWFYAVTAPG